MRKPSTKRMRTRAILVAAVPLLTSTISRTANADNWLNPAGGSWTVGTNWSTKAPPASNDYAIFNMGSGTGYTVSNVNNFDGAIVQGDQPTLSFTGVLNYEDMGFYLDVNSVAGQTSGLTMLNADLSVSSTEGIYIGGTGGTCDWTAINSTIYAHMSAIYFGGQPGSLVNYNQSGGLLSIDDSDGINVGTFGGSVNATISNGANISGGVYGVTVASKGQVTMTIASGAFVGSQTNFVSIGTGAGTANVSTNGGIMYAYRDFVIGAGVPDDGSYAVPATGGGTGVVTMTNGSDLSASFLLLGGSQGNGTMNVSGSTCEIYGSGQISVGDKGTGLAMFSNGSTLVMNGTNCYVGGGGGNGTMKFSGSGTTCIVNKYNNSSANLLDIGSDGTANGAGLLELDHSATLKMVGTQELISLSATGILEVLSGSNVSTAKLMEVPGSTLEIGLDGPSASANGQIDLTSTATFAGTLDVIFENGFQPTAGEQFQLFTFASESGTFSSINLPAGYSYDSSKLYPNGFITITAVPEPISAAGMAGMLLFATLRKNRCKSFSENSFRS